MDFKIDSQVNSLAYHLWLSAGREYQRAVDFWIMAEQMVRELAVASARMAGSAVEITAASEKAAPAIAARHLQRIQELAYFMWEAAGAQCGRALDYWIAAERHVTTMMVVSGEIAGSAAASQSPEPDHVSPDSFSADDFSAAAYLSEIRTGAYYMWEKAGREHCGDPLGFWIAAERQVLNRIESGARMQFRAPAVPCSAAPPLQPGTYAPCSSDLPDAHESAFAPGRDGTASRSAAKPSPLRIRRLESAQGAPTH